MRTKLKRKRDTDTCTNWARDEKSFVTTRGVGSRKYLLHQENFDTEDENYENHEHGLSIKSYKIGSYKSELNCRSGALNSGKRRKTRRNRRRRSVYEIPRSLRRFLDEGDF